MCLFVFGKRPWVHEQVTSPLARRVLSMTTAPRSICVLAGLALLGPAASLPAQGTPGPQLDYWLTGAVGWGLEAHSNQLAAHQSWAIAGALTVQRRALVLSARSVHASPGSASVWDAGLLVGAGTPASMRMRGSVAAGLGRISGPVGSAWTLPVELQLAWRLRPGLAVAAYGFGSFTAPHEMLGMTLALQLGHF